MKVDLENWQVKQLRNYFGENDKTQTAHWAYNVFDKALKEQLTIPVVSQQSELLLGFLNWYDSDRVYPKKTWTNEEAVRKYIKDKL